jgi:hypothetical protein
MNITPEEREFIEFLDEMNGCGCGLLMYKGDPIAFEIGLAEYNERYKEDTL